jgi:hypothetical protein
MEITPGRAEQNRQGTYRDATFNLSAPVLQESTNSMVDGVGFQQLSALANASLPAGQDGTALENAQQLTAYKTTPEEMRERQRERIRGEDGKKRIPLWVWGLGGITLAMFLTRR